MQLLVLLLLLKEAFCPRRNILNIGLNQDPSSSAPWVPDGDERVCRRGMKTQQQLAN